MMSTMTMAPTVRTVRLGRLLHRLDDAVLEAIMLPTNDRYYLLADRRRAVIAAIESDRGVPLPSRIECGWQR